MIVLGDLGQTKKWLFTQFYMLFHYMGHAGEMMVYVNEFINTNKCHQFQIPDLINFVLVTKI